jgi:hypothetical protein
LGGDLVLVFERGAGTSVKGTVQCPACKIERCTLKARKEELETQLKASKDPVVGAPDNAFQEIEPARPGLEGLRPAAVFLEGGLD